MPLRRKDTYGLLGLSSAVQAADKAGQGREDRMIDAGYAPTTGARVWLGRDLQDRRDWVWTLPAAALAEIDERIAALRARGVTLETIGQDDFPLHSIAGDIARIRQEIEQGRGFALIRGLPREKYSDADFELIFWGFGTHFGAGQPQSWLGERLGHVIDLSDEEEEPRAYHRGGHIGMHTDSCDIVALLCLHPARTGGASRLSSAHAVHNLMLERHPALMPHLYAGFHYRSTGPDARGADRPALTPYKVPVFRPNTNWLDTYYVRGYIRRAIAAGDTVLSAAELAALDEMDRIALEPGVYLDMDFRPGDMQFVNNRVIFHGRTDYADFEEKARRRHLLRLWLRVPGWPEIATVQNTHTDAEKWRWVENMRKRQLAPAH
jgi:hypothetical protein